MLNYFKKRLHHYFLPHESNNYKARALHNSAVFFYIVLLIILQFSTHLLKQMNSTVLGYATDITAEKIITLVNQKREEVHLQPLTLSNELSQAATQKANDMFTKDYWAHISPTGSTPWVFINDTGYQYVYAGENLARNFNTSDEVVDAWMNSPTHRANLLKPEYQDIGLSVMNGKLKGEDTTLVVQEFGTKTKSAIAEVIPTTVLPKPVNIESNELAQVKASTVRTIPQFYPTFNKTFSLVLVEFMLVVLFIDSVYLWRTKTPRFGSHSLAHLIFLGALIGAMGATGIGVIL